MAGGAGSGFRSIPCQCTGLKIPSFCCLTVLYGHSRGWMYAEVGRAPWCSYFAVQIILAELLEYHNAQRWVRMLAWQFRLMSAAGWMFRIISAVMFGCFFNPYFSNKGCCKVFCDGLLEVFIRSTRGHPA